MVYLHAGDLVDVVADLTVHFARFERESMAMREEEVRGGEIVTSEN